MALSMQKKEFRYLAMTNAAASIIDFVSGGLEPIDIGLEKDDDEGLRIFSEQHRIVSKQLERQAEAYKRKHNL